MPNLQPPSGAPSSTDGFIVGQAGVPDGRFWFVGVECGVSGKARPLSLNVPKKPLRFSFSLDQEKMRHPERSLARTLRQTQSKDPDEAHLTSILGRLAREFHKTSHSRSRRFSEARS